MPGEQVGTRDRAGERQLGPFGGPLAGGAAGIARVGTGLRVLGVVANVLLVRAGGTQLAARAWRGPAAAVGRAEPRLLDVEWLAVLEQRATDEVTFVARCARPAHRQKREA